MVYWITERYSMKLRREAGQQHPLSADPSMYEPRYCNVHREDDAVTKWLAVNWRPKHHAVWEIVLARMLNYIPTLESIHGVWEQPISLAEISAILKNRRKAGEKVFTSAYTISTCGKSMDKIDYVMSVVAEVKREEVDGFLGFGPLPTLAGTHKQLTLIDGLGSFLAAQVLADLKNTPDHPLQSAPDWHTWAAPGPGSLRGLQAFYGRPVTPSQFHVLIKQCYDEVIPLLPDYIPPIHMQDFQNCLCEFSKFMRYKHGDRRVRNKYRPAEAGGA